VNYYRENEIKKERNVKVNLTLSKHMPAVLLAAAVLTIGSLPVIIAPHQAAAQGRGRGGRGGRGGGGRGGYGGYGGANGRGGPGSTQQPSDSDAFADGLDINAAPSVTSANHVYVSTGYPVFYALDKKTGKLAWTFKPSGGGSITASPAVGPDGTVYVTSFDHNVYAIDPATGKEKWKFPTTKVLATTPAIGKNGLIYVGAEDDNLYILNADGTKNKAIPTGGSVASPTIGPDGTVYIGSDNVYAYDGKTGNLKWTFQDNHYGNSQPLLDPDNNILYFGDGNGTLHAVDAATGNQVWHLPTSGTTESAPVVAPDGNIIFGADKLYAVRPSNGRIRWTVGDGTSNWSGPAVGTNGMIYAGCTDGKIYAIEPRLGRVRWMFPINTALPSAPTVGPSGDIYFVSDGASKVYDLAPTHGELLWETDMPAPPPPPTPPADTMNNRFNRGGFGGGGFNGAGGGFGRRG
jgi:outer membrane protein assembly factor BamB